MDRRGGDPVSYQEDAEHREHQRELVAIEADRQKGIWGSAPLAPDEFAWDRFHLSATVDEFGQQRWFVEDGDADWISEAFDTRDLAQAELERLKEEACA